MKCGEEEAKQRWQHTRVPKVDDWSRDDWSNLTGKFKVSYQSYPLTLVYGSIDQVDQVHYCRFLASVRVVPRFPWGKLTKTFLSLKLEVASTWQAKITVGQACQLALS